MVSLDESNGTITINDKKYIALPKRCSSQESAEEYRKYLYENGIDGIVIKTEYTLYVPAKRECDPLLGKQKRRDTPLIKK